MLSQRYSRSEHLVAVGACHVLWLVKPGVECWQFGVQLFVVAHQGGFLLEGFATL